MALSTDFKDDILNESVNEKRKYQMTYNDDGTVSFTDVTSYSQTGSEYGAAEVNEEREAINALSSALDNDLYFLHIQTSSQSNFSSAKNMLLIDNTNKYGANNKSGYFFMDEDDHSEWTGLPPSMPSGTVLGLRNVYPMNIGAGTENILVEIIEMFPMPGRKYYCFLNYGIWDDWRTVTPS